MKDKVVVVLYETSYGPQTMIFNNADKIITDIDDGIVSIKEYQEDQQLWKMLALINLTSFVSYEVKEKEVEGV